MGVPMSMASAPLARPSVAFKEIARTQLLPIWACTSTIDLAAIHGDVDPIIDGWQFIGGKFDIDHGSNDLYDFTLCHLLLKNF